MSEAALDQVLVDALGVAAEFDLRLDPGAVLFAGRAGLLRRPSRWPWGNLTPLTPGFFRLRAGGHPGGFCLPLVAADGLAIHPRHPLNLPLAGAPLQQGPNRHP